ncbi:hypothetical protein F3Y22_tig00001695pilonHSYRG00029 [Hibiscus syriacus]|uniref:HXXXD-type acyl-transferase family protein n=1 Tax=Hibiscus syriacus TaxID=106335 RepID=A0A6A3CZK8_HIBSY|nr:hypothetical protein F3Y22_tig00001695pilonHSYRG00029 [Hibiscus syriacus]
MTPALNSTMQCARIRLSVTSLVHSMFRVTELGDGVFIGCSVNHAVTDGTSFWNFFNSFAEICRRIGDDSDKSIERIARQPDFTRDSVLISPAILQVPDGRPKVTFNENEALSERIFSFSREAILELKAKVNNSVVNGDFNAVEILGKQSNDKYYAETAAPVSKTAEISSFQSLSALLWRAVEPEAFGNSIQSIPTYASAGDVKSRDLRWCSRQLNDRVRAHDYETVRLFARNWEEDPRCFPLGNFDGGCMTMGSSPRFPMYDNDFGWGRPLAVRIGGANKFDGKISAFPRREGNGSVDLDVVLAPETMAAIESDVEFMQYVMN